ncbi:PHD finger protein 21B isoform X3 [Xiphias gladius]|uniref:PHD finger protein 21B isoform X3 n=1 Tax=Xiphias gladius TaxID=8245 RepID=UPI001A9948F5|nr:PHD finger protein 21B isoform X3 [Xiphias gladius]
MELQGLQEALKVEIQCHQDGELKRQLHDRQTRITALSDKQNQTLCKGLNELQNGQKLAVRSCPVGTTKPLSLIKPPSQGIAISVVPAKAPVSMVTAHINGQKAAGSEPLQTSPINLQTGGRVAAAGVHPFGSRRAGELPPSQMLGTLTAVPIKVPQVSSLHRLTGQAATVLPQVIIIQPQAPSSTEGSPGAQADLPSQEAPPAPTSPSQKKDEDPEKIAFMVALGLVTTEHLEEIQTKRQERKRRSTANPAYSGLFEPERKRLASHYLNSSLFLSARDTEDFCWKEGLEHDDHCAVCKEDGELQPCHNCPRAFHPDCLHPPLKTPPRGPWYCPKCQKKVLNKENMSWPQNFVQSYVTHKTVRQEEKRRLLRRNNELKKECTHLEEQDKQLNKTLKQCMDLRERLLGQQRDTQASLDRLKALIRLIQRDQVIQVTMTTTTTIAASLLSQSWIKPTSTAAPGPSATPLQKSHAHSPDKLND